MTSSSPPPAAIFTLGDVLADTYEVRSILGAGGMGQVFDAHDRGLGRRVAIKANWRRCPNRCASKRERSRRSGIPVW